MRSSTNPNELEILNLKCKTASFEVTSFEFFLDGDSVADISLNFHYAAKNVDAHYIVESPTIGAHDGNYTCVAKIDTVTSAASNTKTIVCK